MRLFAFGINLCRLHSQLDLVELWFRINVVEKFSWGRRTRDPRRVSMAGSWSRGRPLVSRSIRCTLHWRRLRRASASISSCGITTRTAQLDPVSEGKRRYDHDLRLTRGGRADVDCDIAGPGLRPTSLCARLGD